MAGRRRRRKVERGGPGQCDPGHLHAGTGQGQLQEGTVGTVVTLQPRIARGAVVGRRDGIAQQDDFLKIGRAHV